MIQQSATLFLYLLLAVLALPQSLMAKETITWLEATFPPYLIHQGEYKGQGYGDIVGDILTEHLDQYEHKRMIANISRHYRMYKRGEKVIEDVNKALRQQRPTKAYRAAYERWLDKAGIARYREVYDRYFLSVTQ